MTILRPIVRPICRPILRSPLAGPRGDALTTAVKAMFASGEPGVMFDLTRAANLYTDSARTTLVTASGEQVGSATDLSPNAKHASSAGTARPVWNSAGYATFDAFDDYLQTAAIDFSATDAVTVIACVRKTSDAAAAWVVSLNSLNTGSIALLAPNAATPSFGFGLSGGTFRSAVVASGYVSPINAVLTGEGKTTTDFGALRVNGTQVATISGDIGDANLANGSINIGQRSTGASWFSGRIYRVLIIGRALTTTERNLAERWAAQPVGITIP